MFFSLANKTYITFLALRNCFLILQWLQWQGYSQQYNSI
uniref:Uncharacterized protein n=1 Tax=Anguilla anguilla TaxID=7936 RepID=A0A0E9QHV8_ANGAN